MEFYGRNNGQSLGERVVKVKNNSYMQDYDGTQLTESQIEAQLFMCWQFKQKGTS